MKNMPGKTKKGRRILAVLMVLMMTVMTFAPYQMGLSVAYGEEEQSRSELGASSVQQNVQSQDEQTPAADPDNVVDVNSNENAAVNSEEPKANEKKSEEKTEAADAKSEDSSKEADKKSEKKESKKAADKTKDGGELSYSGSNFKTVISYDEKADLPEGTKLKVNDVDKKDNHYDELYKNAVKAVQPSGKKDVKTLSFVKFYDIDLMNDGKEIEPSASVDVNFDFAASLSKDLKAENKNNVHIIHLKEIGRTGTYKTEVLGKEDVDPTIEGSRLTETSFKADSFSVYAVVYTVDFHYGDYDYSIKGKSDIMLSELFEKLKIDIPAADVEKAEFSDPSLVKVEKVKGSDSSKDDWKISSLKPFASKEKLTIETLYGTFMIEVTDAQYQYNYRIVASNGTLRGETNDLQTAYNNASNGDTIQVCKDNAITACVNINTTNKNVTLTSADPEHPCTISRTSYNGRMFDCTYGSLTIKDVIIDGNNIDYSNRGAIFFVHIQGRLTMEDGAVLKRGIAASSGDDGRGGAVYLYGVNAYFTMNGGIIEECKAYRTSHYAGGGICIKESDHFTMNGGIIRNCHAPNSAGGAIAVDHNDEIYIKGGLITECTAGQRGGAIETHGATHMSGGTITKCDGGRVGGAINMYTTTGVDEGVVYFSGSPKIYDNYNNYDPDNVFLCNLDVYHHNHGTTGTSEIASTDKVRLEGQLNSDAMIGIWAGEGDLEGRFGIRVNDGVSKANLDCFTNDRNPELVGTYGSGMDLIWAKGIKVKVKLLYKDNQNISEAIDFTPGTGRYSVNYSAGDDITKSIDTFRTEYQQQKSMKFMIDDDSYDFRFAVVESDSGSITDEREIKKVRSKRERVSGNKQYKFSNFVGYSDTGSATTNLDTKDSIVLVYKITPNCKMTDAQDNLLHLNDGAPAVFKKPGTAMNLIGNYYTDNGSQSRYNSTNYGLKMLVDSYSMDSAIDAESDISDTQNNPNKVDYSKYNVTFTTDVPSGQFSRVTSADKKCVVSREDYFTNGNLIKSKLNQLKLEKIVLDGKNVSSSGGAVSVKNGKLEVSNAEIKNSITSANGGAINASKATVSVTNGTKITNCKSSNENGGGGGAIYAQGTDLTVTNSTIEGCSTTGSNAHGGAINLVTNGNDAVSAVKVNGTTQIKNCSSLQTGGAIAVFNNCTAENGTKVTITDNVKFVDNIAIQGGGAIHVRNNNPVIDITGNVQFTGNKATGNSNDAANNTYGSGGALHLSCLGTNSQVNIQGSDIRFTGNTAANSGGAIYVQDTGDSSITGKVLFDENEASNGNGGAIMVDNGQSTTEISGRVNIQGTDEGGITFTNNKAKGESDQNTYKGCGGAIFAQPKLVIKDSVFGGSEGNGNTASGSGGAVWNGYSNENGSVITNSVFSYNTAAENGGAIHANEYIKISSSKIEHNSATNGGGFSTYGWKNNELKDTVVKNNSATSSGSQAGSGLGGGIYMPNGNLKLCGTTKITNNTASGKGGGLYIDKGVVSVQDKLLITNNTSSLGSSDNLHEMKGNYDYAIIMTGDLTDSAIGVYSENKNKPDGYQSYQFGRSDKSNGVYDGVYMFMNDYYQELRGVSKDGSNGLYWPEESAVRIKKVVNINEGQNGPKDGEDTEYTFKVKIAGTDFQGNDVAYAPETEKTISVPNPWSPGQNVTLKASWDQVHYRIYNSDHTPAGTQAVSLTSPESELKLKNGQYALVDGIFTGRAKNDTLSIGYLKKVTVDVEETNKQKANEVNVTTSVGALVGNEPSASHDGAKASVVFDYTGMNYPASHSNNKITSGSNADLTFYNNYTEDPTIPLTITKNVTGNYARYDQPFTFHVSIDGKTEADSLACVKMTTGGAELTGSDQQKTVKAKSGEFQLTHGQKIVIQVPEDSKVTVTEDAQSGYNATFTLGEGTEELSGTVDNGKHFKVGDDAAQVDVTNAFDDSGVVPSGLPSGIYKLLILLGLVLTCAALILREFLINTRRTAE